MCFPSGPVPRFAEVMIRLSFSEDPFHFWPLPLRREKPRTLFLPHVLSWDGIVENTPFRKLRCSPDIRLVCGHLSNRTPLRRKERAFLVEKRNLHIYVGNVRGSRFHRSNDVRRWINAGMDFVAVPFLRCRLVSCPRVGVGTPSIETIRPIIIFVRCRPKMSGDVHLRMDGGGIENPQLFIK